VSFDWAILAISDIDLSPKPASTNNEGNDEIDKSNLTSGLSTDAPTDKAVDDADDIDIDETVSGTSDVTANKKNNNLTNNTKDDTQPEPAEPVITKRYLDVHLNFDAPRDD
jgi:hypothetical protein